METLVLSQSYMPVARVSWQRALTLVFAGKVEVVEEYEDWTVRSVTLELKVPSIVRFVRKIFGIKPKVRFSRENVYARDKGRCQYCQKAVSRAEATFDHVVPRAQGGHTRWENIVIACTPCNQKKGGRTPEQAKMALAVLPARPKRLPDILRLTFSAQKSMPESWKYWLRSVSYWAGELESD